jgi:hypothetical protein
LTNDASIFAVSTVVDAKAIVRTVDQPTLSSHTVHIVQPDLPTTLAKESTGLSNGTLERKREREREGETVISNASDT